MAVNINTVYQTVLYILNKEQRGYLPPSEFNSFAELVQLEIFNSYFPDGNQLNRYNQNNTQNNTEFFNIFENNRYKLYPFENEIDFQFDITTNLWQPNSTRPVRLLGNIISTYNSTLTNTTPSAKINPKLNSITQNVSKSDYDKIVRSKLTAPTAKYPLAYQTNLITSAPSSPVCLVISPLPDSVKVNCILEPTKPTWNFYTGNQGQYIFDNTSIGFQLDISEKTNLILGILKYAGVVVNNPTVIEVAEQEARKVEVNEKS
mgnify:FL=1|tara:strand:- start:486 stop:1268 length:783 start_codon:yes stop_codon:yes gene_type:complete